MKIAADNERSAAENEIVYTEQYFGCIYWRESDGVLIDTSAIVKDEIKKKVKELVEETMPASEYEVTCKNCGSINCISNYTCINCKCQL